MEAEAAVESEQAEALTIRTPDDWHLHLRDGDVLRAVAPLSERQFGRVLVMPNLKPPVKSAKDAEAYRERILNVVPGWQVITTLYLTDETTPEMIREASETDHILACKLYPAGATTNSAHGVRSIEALYPAFQAMEEYNIVLCIHGEAIEADMFDRERLFVNSTLVEITERFPALRIVLEHVSTREAVDFVLGHGSDRIAATITPQHLCCDRNDLFPGSRLNHHMFCLPILKTREDRDALRAAVESGSKRFFAGTDSAPHPIDVKLGGAAGCFSAPAAVEFYAEVFEEMGILPNLEAFLSENGADFYGVPRNPGTITLTKTPHIVPASVKVGAGIEHIVPMRAGEALRWSVTAGDRRKPQL